MPPEIGSEFHWDPAVLLDPERGGLPRWLPARRELFATASGALSSLLSALAPPGRLHVPSYFCMGVAEFLARQLPVVFYRHLPEEGPRWETLRAADGDVVLAQNLFGREEGTGWHDWTRAHPRVTVIEDHSHDPFSDWARTSTAAYAVASLRKTLPLPDGGLLWSPSGHDLPRPFGTGSQRAAGLKLAAMLLKTAWQDGRPIPKDRFRTLQQQGEQQILGSAAETSAVTAALLPFLDIEGIRSSSSRNAQEVATALGDRVLGAGGFRVQLVLASESERDVLLAYLARIGIFAPVHWRQDRDGFWSGDEEAAALAGRMLTLPVDHRCGPADLQRIVESIEGFARMDLSGAI
ncbi:hypothetical protein Aph02nite_11940 [Actinoplanes philippinensis]|uniref:dTDP-4-amino-4,6-dideoxygalactose transaminase n=1 Tax=Actinoplanes philippinensis TaxID=35752 RepID=A0A1I1ZWK7_9ACTN|nr:hypothetical protein [Actinoplanes philippinensis]GIE75244.1 hypothetical protein Aph02nite_11940 [Actinoplanes philippinensis]SFE36045.1 hypothetical protein SAMN05421541_101342 [Actinoplanes philippinensis]